MKRVLLWAVILLLLAGAGVLIAISQIDTRFVADKISAALREATGAPLVFREAPRISLHPLGLSFGHVDWHQQQPGRDLHITAEGGHVRLDITPLLSGNLVVSEVTLRSPDIALRLRPDTPGPQTDAPTADSSLRQEAPAGKETSQTGESMFPVPSDELPLELQRLVVQDGRLSLDDGAGRHVEINGLQLVLTDIRSRADMGLDLALAYALRQQQNEASGKLSVRGLLRYYAPNI
ncbi:MAG: AsmA family protein, partial [Desulfovibrionaceae bacterium]|nr:AsmA family protein [Desulfovibrionaceae bacterium]